MAPRRAVFLDLNGTLVTPVLVERLADLEPIDGALESVARLTRAGFACPVVTVQSRIEKGLFSELAFRAWFGDFAARAAALGAELAGPYVCPHRFRTPCACAKPETLLYERAAAEHDLDPSRSFVVGDTMDDLEAARRLGGRGCLVLTGEPLPEKESARARDHASFVGRDLSAVVDWILRHPGG